MRLFAYIFIAVTVFSCKNVDEPSTPVNSQAPAAISYSITSTAPHDKTSYTQGLVIHKGELYEGTGNYGLSKLRKIELTTGNSIKELKLDSTYFGEGITILNDTIYQLTWKEK